MRLPGPRDPAELMTEAKDMQAPLELVKQVAREGKLPVPNFAAGGVATPADAALCMMLGAESVFVGSGSSSPRTRRGAPRRSSRRSPTGRTRRWCSRRRAGSKARCPASTSPSFTPEEMLSRRGW